MVFGKTLLQLSVLLLISHTCAQQAEEPLYEYDKLPMTMLSNGKPFPLVGFGVGNLEHHLIKDQVQEGMGMHIRLIDTAHASSNEQLIVRGVEAGLKEREVVHVVTKVWYTYMGYNRTLISVKESLEALQSSTISIRVHMLIHWPFCNDEISWMDCEAEEEGLPDEVKAAGPPPHLHKDTAWRDTWRALEDIYLGSIHLGDGLPTIESIGVSNFDSHQLQELVRISRVSPSIVQGNLWVAVHDPVMMNLCHANHIHFQAYNIMNGVFSNTKKSPLALEALWDIGRSISPTNKYAPPAIIMKWLVQNDVSVIPRTTNVDHMYENSPEAIASIPDLDQRQLERVKIAVSLMMQGKDMDPPMVVFFNKQAEKIFHLFWYDENGEEKLVKEDLQSGEHFQTFTYTGHKFVAYNKDRTSRQEFTVQAEYGERQQFHIEL